MAKSLNEVRLIGHIGADPETRYQGNGKAVTEMRLATTDSWKDEHGQKQERTEWHRVAFFGKLAEIAGEYLSKGRQVFIAGELRTDKFTDREGVERYSTKVVANDLIMLGGAPASKESAPARSRQSRPAANAARDALNQPEGPRDDIPF